MTATANLDLAARMDALPSGLRVPAPPFEFDLSVGVDYARALAGTQGESLSEDQLVVAARARGRALVLGNGGSGKTSLMGRLWRDAKAAGRFATWIDLRAWRQSLDASGDWPQDDDRRAEILLERLATPSVSQAELDLANAAAMPLILIDGINEVPNDIAETLVVTADFLASRHPNATVIVTDRLVRRSSIDDRWLLIRLVAAHEPGQPASDDALLRNAFFLNKRINAAVQGESASEVVESYLTQHATLTPSEVRAAARAAAAAYAQYARSFQLEDFRKIAGADTVVKLRQAGALVVDVVDESEAIFEHHLIHDVLAATWLAGEPDEWRATRFDQVTFKASSFDALALTLERIADPSSVDLFIRRVYDWNYYGAAYTLARAQQLGQVRVSATMHVALLAMLAERRWDPVVATVNRVEDALRMVGGPLADRLLDAGSPQEVREVVAREPGGDPLLQRWRALFLRDDNQPVEPQLIAALDDDESLIGWTAANVLRRSRRSSVDEREVIARLAGASPPVVRWRSAHVLGGWSTPEGHEALRHAILHEPDDWVRYGAIRSLVDNAASDAEHRDALLGWMRDSLDALRDGPPQVLVELERSLLRRPEPFGWRTAVSPLIEDAYATATDEDEVRRWERLARQLRDVPSKPT
jgi:hypothetical protein